MREDKALREGFWIEDWFVEPQLGRIKRGGLRHQVEPKIMEALILLAEEYPKVVCKDRFLQQVWGDVNVVNHVVARAISELRRVFGDEARNPRIIETIPKGGYRLIAPPGCRPTSNERVQTSGTDNDFARRDVGRRRNRLSLFVAGALVAVGFLFLWIIVAGGSHSGFPGH